jgi:Na+-driven multidrug efflux pump
VPAIRSMLVRNIYNLVDTAFGGKLGTSASGAVGIVFGFMTVIQAFGFMFGQGAGSILSRSLGDRDPQKASVHATAGFCSGNLRHSHSSCQPTSTTYHPR